MAHAVQQAHPATPGRGGEDDAVLVEYLGRGDAHELVADTPVSPGDDPVAVPRDLRDGALWLDGSRATRVTSSASASPDKARMIRLEAGRPRRQLC